MTQDEADRRYAPGGLTIVVFVALWITSASLIVTNTRQSERIAALESAVKAMQKEQP